MMVETAQSISAELDTLSELAQVATQGEQGFGILQIVRDLQFNEESDD